LPFLPSDEVIFKIDGKEVDLQGVFDSQDWNPKQNRKAVFDFLKKSEDKSHAE